MVGVFNNHSDFFLRGSFYDKPCLIFFCRQHIANHAGIISAFLLAFSRAVGETMIVALAAGSTPTLTVDPRHEIQTMTGFMAQFANPTGPAPGTGNALVSAGTE